ncbi:MAG: glycosyltransferase family 2 protein [Rhizobiaceae bacterium]
MAALSVILPVRDGEKYIDAAIASIRAQTFGDFELLVIDDGSRDGTAAIVERHAAADPRIRLLPNGGAGGLVSALNFALSQAQAPLIARMDADDIAMPDRFERQMARMLAEPDLQVLGGGYIEIDGDGREGPAVTPPQTHDEIVRVLQRVNCIAHPTVLMRRPALEAVGGYREAYVRAEDYDLWLRLAEHGRLGNLPEPLIRYRSGHVPFRAKTFGRQVMSEIAARAAARLRASGRPDPTGGWHNIDAEALASLGVDAGALASEMTRRALQMARNSRKAGDLDSFRTALRVADMQPRHGLGERLRYLLRRTKAARL